MLLLNLNICNDEHPLLFLQLLPEKVGVSLLRLPSLKLAMLELAMLVVGQDNGLPGDRWSDT